MGGREIIMIQGTKVDPVLLEPRSIGRCVLDECHAACCTEGVYVFSSEVSDVRRHADLIGPHLEPGRRDPAGWFDGETIEETDHPLGGTAEGTVVYPDGTHPAGRSCVFLRSDKRCGLQVAGVAAGEHPWRFKPFWCALHPLEFDCGVLTLAEDSAVYQSGGSCNRPQPGHAIPIFRLFEEEVTLALGTAGFAELEAIADTPTR